MSEWRRVQSPYRNYEVSSEGEIRRDGRILGGHVDRYGYRTVLLYYAGLSKRHKVHRLVCEAFHGPRPLGHEVCHSDGVRSNNSASNLRWGTRSENVQDAIRHGTHRAGTPPKEAMSRGGSHSWAKLTEAQVIEARRRHAAGLSGRQLAREYGVTSANMSRALRGASWRHVNADAPNLQGQQDRSDDN